MPGLLDILRQSQPKMGLDYFPPAPAAPNQPMTMAGGDVKGLLQPGNIDLSARPIVKNKDGSISTVRSMSFQNDSGQEVLIPTVSDDGTRILSNQEAMEQYGRTGQHLGIFDNPDDATAYALSLHDQQDKMYSPDRAQGGILQHLLRGR